MRAASRVGWKPFTISVPSHRLCRTVLFDRCSETTLNGVRTWAVHPSMLSTSGFILVARIFCVMNLGALAVLFASAGLVVQDFRGLDVHGFGAIGIHVTSGLLATALVLLAWLSRTGMVAALLAVAMCGFTFLQAWWGSAATLVFHVSGALVLTIISTWLTAWAFSSRRRDSCGTSRRRHPHPEGASA